MEEVTKRAVLVSMAQSQKEYDFCTRSLDELCRLLETAGGEEFARVIQIKSTPEPRTVIGSGKVQEIRELCESYDIPLVVFDFELTPSQIRNLEEDIGCAEVLDRSMLILDIFALHAVSGEGKLQVELAQLKYTAPRLIGKGAALSRQGGGIGSRGPGESKLETDRRHVKERIHSLECQLKEMEHNRMMMRRARDRSGVAKVAIVGYTNAGKSTLLNRLTDAGVLSEDKLFATLDPTTRRLTLPSGENVLLTDTVGFIRKLPHHLVEAFKSTLDEVRYADILMLVADVSDSEVREQLAVTEDIIEQLGASDKPRLYVYNKCDTVEGLDFAALREDTVAISAKQGRGIDALLSMIETLLHRTKREVTLLIPYDKQFVTDRIYKEYTVNAVEYGDLGVSMRCLLDQKGLGMYRDYVQDDIFEDEDEDEEI